MHIAYRDTANRTGRHLFREYVAYLDRAAAPLARQWRASQGWPRSATLMGLGGGVARVQIAEDGTFEPAEGGGHPAIILPAWAGPAPGRFNNLVDLVAWLPASGQMFTRRRVADLLGEWALLKADCLSNEGHSLMVYRDPGEWARAATWEDRGGHGVVIVNWQCARDRLGHLKNLIAPDITTGRRLREATAPAPQPRPSIFVTQDRGGVV